MRNFVKTDKVELLYVISCVIAFALLFFANAEAQETPDGNAVQLGIGKSFYFPCGVALAASFFLQKKKDKIDRNLNLIILFTAFSSLINPPVGSNILTWQLTRFLFAIFCFRDIRHVNPLLVTKAVAYISPLIVFPHYIFTNPFSYGTYRYGGFYGDPNFLALALNLVIVLCYITIMKSDKKIIKITCGSTIVGAIPLILVGMSRGGILGLVIIAYFLLRTLYNANKKWFVVIICLMCFVVPRFSRGNTDLLQMIEMRFKNESESDKGSTDNRIKSIKSVTNVMTGCPYLIPFGVGMGNTIPSFQKYSQHGVLVNSEIHNTFFSLLYQAGLIVLILYLSIFSYGIKMLYKAREYLLLFLLLTSMLSLFTLPGISFMPGWILLFLLTNPDIYKLQIK